MRGQDPQFYAKQLKAMNGDNIFHDLGFYKLTYFRLPSPYATSRPRTARRASATCALVWPMWADCSAIGD
ncbi:MAG: hypothetical protein ACLS6O_00540 [Bifidobacterium sp.]